VLELVRVRRSGYGYGSDADQIARLTRLPATLWIGVLGLATVGSLASGTWLLLLR
jgi:hypothetical protein